MRYYSLFFLLSIFGCVACGDGEADVSRELIKAVREAARDGEISAAECATLQDLAAKESPGLLVTPDSWEGFLLENKPRIVSEVTISCVYRVTDDGKPEPPNTSCPPAPAVANFYVENSRSMYGYLVAGGEFQRVMSDYVLQFDKQQQPFKLYFINNEVFPVSEQNGEYAGSEDIFERKRHFESYLNQQKMDALGNTGSSKLMKILNVVTDRAVESCEVQFLVSDYIYSLSGVADMKQQMGGIQSDVSLLVGKVAKAGLGTLLIKYSSKFDGQFFPWNSPNKGFAYDGQRPYYVWVFGAPAYLQTFAAKYAVEKQAGYEASALFLPRNLEQPKYGIFPTSGNPRGEFRKSPKMANPVHELSDVAASTRRGAEGLRFAVGTDLTRYPVSIEYLSDPRNYVINGPEEEHWRVAEIIPIAGALGNRDQELANTINPTHLIILEADDVESASSSISIRFIDQKPAWLARTHTDNDEQSKIEEVTDKTFGFSYLSDGVWDAYHDRSAEQYFFELPLTLKR